MQRNEKIAWVVAAFCLVGLVLSTVGHVQAIRAYNAQVVACPRAIAWVADSCGCDLNVILDADKNSKLCNEGYGDYCGWVKVAE